MLFLRHTISACIKCQDVQHTYSPHQRYSVRFPMSGDALWAPMIDGPDSYLLLLPLSSLRFDQSWINNHH